MSHPPTYTIMTAADRADLRALADDVTLPAWPEFILHDPGARRWEELYDRFPKFQFGLFDSHGGDLLAVGNSLPLTWEGNAEDLPDTAWDWALDRGLRDQAEGRLPHTHCALQIVVLQRHRGKRLSAEAVEAMKAVGRAQGLPTLVVPARPTLKSRYPLTPIEDYITWTNEAGLPFDPWLRVHLRLGGRIVKVCPRSMRVTGTVAEWERWTNIEFPESGRYIVPGGLVPVEIDRAADFGLYLEPNIWIAHT